MENISSFISNLCTHLQMNIGHAKNVHLQTKYLYIGQKMYIRHEKKKHMFDKNILKHF